jgi:hypothetical protein
MILLAMVLSLALLVVAVLHAWWGMGGIWPAANEADLARGVIGDGRTRMPPPWQCFAVAIVLAGLAAWPWLILAWPEHDLVVAGSFVIAGVFFVRAMAAYSPRWRSHFPAEPFATRDRRFYGPLCLTLAVGFLALLEQGL